MIPPFDENEALVLSNEAGWNQTVRDWQRLLELTPDGCLGKRVEGRLVSTATALVYAERLAWIGMVLTTEAQRGKGFARELLGKALAYCDERGVRCVKLDATDLGRPVYARLGFVEERPVRRWIRPAGPFPGKAEDLGGEVDFELDREAFGADRSALLRSLEGEEVYAAPGRGYAMSRPGRLARFFGPCVARDEETARRLLGAFLERHAGEAAAWDLCDEHEAAARVAREAGFAPVRRLMRMYRGDAAGMALAAGSMIYGLAGFEFG
ncbi:MAG: GNAT family N-acetyltransferase [Bryobacterales bacterium]|nr:GNAT family N-acetyltransferase [Bryobacterales bacterium]